LQGKRKQALKTLMDQHGLPISNEYGKRPSDLDQNAQVQWFYNTYSNSTWREKHGLTGTVQYEFKARPGTDFSAHGFSMTVNTKITGDAKSWNAVFAPPLAGGGQKAPGWTDSKRVVNEGNPIGNWYGKETKNWSDHPAATGMAWDAASAIAGALGSMDNNNWQQTVDRDRDKDGNFNVWTEAQLARIGEASNSAYNMSMQEYNTLIHYANNQFGHAVTDAHVGQTSHSTNGHLAAGQALLEQRHGAIERERVRYAPTVAAWDPASPASMALSSSNPTDVALVSSGGDVAMLSESVSDVPTEAS
jgi:hypothetical protein